MKETGRKRSYKSMVTFIAGLLLILGLAVYLNWQFASSGGGLKAAEAMENMTEGVSPEKNYGDAAFVGASSVQGLAEDAAGSVNSASGDEYFVEARLNRQSTRDEAVAVIKEAISDVKSDDKTRSKAAADIAEIAKQIEIEGKIENLVKAKGFADCMVYIDGDNVDVVVNSEGLVPSQVIQIKDIVRAQAKNEGDIKIVEVK